MTSICFLWKKILFGVYRNMDVCWINIFFGAAVVFPLPLSNNLCSSFLDTYSFLPHLSFHGWRTYAFKVETQCSSFSLYRKKFLVVNKFEPSRSFLEVLSKTYYTNLKKNRSRGWSVMLIIPRPKYWQLQPENKTASSSNHGLFF